MGAAVVVELDDGRARHRQQAEGYGGTMPELVGSWRRAWFHVRAQDQRMRIGQAAPQHGPDGTLAGRRIQAVRAGARQGSGVGAHDRERQACKDEQQCDDDRCPHGSGRR